MRLDRRATYLFYYPLFGSASLDWSLSHIADLEYGAVLFRVGILVIWLTRQTVILP